MRKRLSLIPLTGAEELLETQVRLQNKTWLRFERDNRIFTQIEPDNDQAEKVETVPLPPQLWLEVLDEEKGKAVRIRHERQYQKPVVIAYAKALKELKLPKDTHYENRAAVAYINTLPNDIPVVIMWGM